MTNSQALLRFALLIAALAIAVVLIAAHGVRGLGIVVAVGLLVTLPRTSGWQTVERVLVRFTGSRRRAALVVMLVFIGILAAINLYGLFG